MRTWQLTAGLVALALGSVLVLAPETPLREVSQSTTQWAPTERTGDAAKVVVAPVAAVEAPPLFFTATETSAPRRLPSSPTLCTRPPPMGVRTSRIVEASRNGSCGQALGELEEAMAVSVDYCRLYKDVSDCFFKAAQPLFSQEAATWAAFEALLPTFEGPNGIELWLEAHATSPYLHRAVTDLYGEPTVADHLDELLALEAAAALGLASQPLEARTPELVSAWAARVRVVARARSGRAEVLLRNNRAKRSEALAKQLRQAVGRDPADAVPEVPRAVLMALHYGELEGETELWPDWP